MATLFQTQFSYNPNQFAAPRPSLARQPMNQPFQLVHAPAIRPQKSPYLNVYREAVRRAALEPAPPPEPRRRRYVNTARQIAPTPSSHSA